MAVERNVEIVVQVVPDKENLKRFEGIANRIKDLQRTTATGMAEMSKATLVAPMAAAEAATRTAFQASKDFTRQQVELRSASEGVVESMGRTMTGVTSLARGFVMVGLIGEENMNKVAQALVKVQAGFDIARGTGDLIVGLTKWASAYDTLKSASVAANLAAARSHDVLAASQTRQATAATLAAQANGSAATAAGGLAAANSGAAGSAGAAGFGMIATKLAGLGAVSVAATAAIGGVAAIISGDFREMLFEWIGITSKAADAQKEHTAAMRAAAARDASAVRNLEVQDERRRNWDAYREQVAPRGAFDLMQDYQSARKASHAAYGQDGSEAALLQRQQATQRELDVLQKMKALQSQQFEEAKKYNLERIRGAQEVLRLKQQEYEKQLQLADALKAELTGSKVAFGNLSPQEQARAAAAKRKMDAAGPESLSVDERDILGRIGLGSVNEKLDAAAMARADKAGYSRLFGQEERSREAQARTAAGTLKAEITGGMRLDHAVTVKVDTDSDALAEKIARAISAETALLPNIDKLIAETVDRLIVGKERVCVPFDG